MCKKREVKSRAMITPCARKEQLKIEHSNFMCKKREVKSRAMVTSCVRREKFKVER
jgi:hypothetical protein